MHKQAKRGGEIGANGEYYPGGAFINTVPENPKGSAKPKLVKAARKEEISAYKWEFPPVAGQRSIFSIVGTVAGYINRDNPALGIQPFADGIAYFGDTFQGYKVSDLCEMYNRGERWVTPR